MLASSADASMTATISVGVTWPSSILLIVVLGSPHRPARSPIVQLRSSRLRRTAGPNPPGPGVPTSPQGV